MQNERIETKIVHQTPDFLYKILSSYLWQETQCSSIITLPAEDNAFIHLATEEQLKKIIAKYWANAPQVVILKLDRHKLQGRLAYETNVGGSNKYYHLYEGFIPYNAIVESRIIYKQPLCSCNDHILDIVQAGDPVLRKPARDLSCEEILNPEIQALIETMKLTMRAAPGVGLAAPQIGKSIQLAVIEDMDQSFLTAEQIKEHNRYPVPFHVIINPRLYIEESSIQVEFFEACLSISHYMSIVSRAETVRVECLNERAEPVVIHAKGWYARILQHEIDHLNGILYIDRALLSTFTTKENHSKLWKGKSIEEIKSHLIN